MLRRWILRYRSNEPSRQQSERGAHMFDISRSSRLAVSQSRLKSLTDVNFVYEILPCGVLRELLHQPAGFFFNARSSQMFPSPVSAMKPTIRQAGTRINAPKILRGRESFRNVALGRREMSRESFIRGAERTMQISTMTRLP
jgi:hypothetical protein